MLLHPPCVYQQGTLILVGYFGDMKYITLGASFLPEFDTRFRMNSKLGKRRSNRELLNRT